MAPELGAAEIERLRSGLRLLALRSLGDPDAAENVAQEAVARTIEAVRNGRPRDVGSFAYGVARNLIFDRYAARSRERRLRASPPSWPRAPAGPVERLLDRERRRRVREALDRLSPSDREILKLSFYDGLTPAEIAERLGEPGPRIRKRKSRALERIRRVFMDEEPAGPGESG